MAGPVADLEPARRLYTAEQCRALDAKACEALAIPSYSLMERAGLAVFEAARRVCPGARRWTILCGAGNNGGDGYVIARLARAAGLQIDVIALRSPATLVGDAARAASAWLAAGGTTRDWHPGLAELNPGPDGLLVDAILGTGLERDVTGEFRAAIAAANAAACTRLAVDLPSGLSADAGRVMGLALRADFTVTLIGAKLGLYTADGPDHAGHIVFAGLGLPLALHDSIAGTGRLFDRSELAVLQRRQRNSHKGSYGHVLVAGGNRGMSGAARLAGEAAMRCGAGLVSIATHPEHAPFLNLERPELMVHGVAPMQGAEVSSRESTAGGPDTLARLLDRASALALGPGLGQDAWGRALLERCLAVSQVRNLPVVLDADALNLLAEKRTEKGSEPFSQTTVSKKGSDPTLPLGQRVITPHPAEAARQLGWSTAEVQADRPGACRAVAKQYEAICVLKGCGTVVASPGAEWGICSLGNPGLATGGSGDVLTGVIAALLAQGLDAWSAAVLGVTAHAQAGDLAAHAGERGLLASDLLPTLRQLVNPGQPSDGEARPYMLVSNHD